jgi:anhydro-N-acetylmuramic acid kinase
MAQSSDVSSVTGPPPRRRLIAGAMSGTSADGVDAAIVEITGRGLDMTARLVAHHAVPFGPALRSQIFRIRQEPGFGIGEVAWVGREVGLRYAEAVRGALESAGLSSRDLAAVAAHGQTVYHDPPTTLQLFDPSLLAAEVDCPVVSDLRRADCAAGGQGAPLVPFADYILFRSNERSRSVINIGGIANMTYLPAGATIDQVQAFDIGPGNCISAHLLRKSDPDGPGIDIDGQLALRGASNAAVRDACDAHPFFRTLGPKSTDGPQMIQIFEQAVRDHAPDLSLADQLATACSLTALTIVRQRRARETILSGGGIRNKAIMSLLHPWQETRWRTTDEFGIPSEAKEALAFALLGAATLDGVPSNVPSATGARRAVVLGSITPRP